MSTKLEKASRIDNLIEEVKENLSELENENVQEELARLLALGPIIKNRGMVNLVGNFEVAVRGLLHKPPYLKLAATLRLDIQDKIKQTRGPFSDFFRPKSPVSLVIWGLIISIYVALPLVIFLASHLDHGKTILGFDANNVVLVGFAGALGSVVSIMVRIQDFSDKSDVDPLINFFTGIFKPFIGIAFSLFVYSIMNAKLLPINIDSASHDYFFFALAFLSGFSERFAKDIVNQAEASMGGNEAYEPPPPRETAEKSVVQTISSTINPSPLAHDGQPQIKQPTEKAST